MSDPAPAAVPDEQPVRAPEAPAAAVSRRGLLARLGATYAKGMAMGSADLIPGVSGGTVAIIVGVYGNLLESLGALSTPAFLRPLLRGRLTEAFRAMHGEFLFPLLAGIATAVILLSRLILHLLAAYPHQVMALFLGLVAASALVVGRHVQRWGRLSVALLVAGVGLGLAIVTLSPVETPSGPAFLFLSGFLAICAMVLPGISGAFVLVLLGKYDVALQGLARLDLGIIVPIGLGAVVGLLSFARLLAYLLRRYHDPMIALLTGFMIGGLYEVWPFVGEHGRTWPWATGEGAGALLVGGIVLAGAALVFALERLGAGRSGLLATSRSSFSSTGKFTSRR